MLISIAYTWNEFLFALTISSRESITVPVHMAGAAGTRGIQFWFVGVRVLIAMAPPVILALLAQRFIVRGLTVGALIRFDISRHDFCSQRDGDIGAM